MQSSSPASPRRRGARSALRLLLVVAIALAGLLAFLTSAPTSSALLVPRRSQEHHRLSLRTTLRRAVVVVHEQEQQQVPAPPPPDAVLLPDWEVLLLLHPDAPPVGDSRSTNATCAFPGGAASPARSLGRMPASGRQAFTCAMPGPERRHKPAFRAPALVFAAAATNDSSSARTTVATPETPLLRWSGRLVYDAAALDDGSGDVLVLAKGVNPRQGVNRNASDVRCVYYRRDAVVVASLPANTSAQQVFRCPPPPTTSSIDDHHLRVTLAVAGEEPIPSMATYSTSRPPPAPAAAHQKKKHQVQVCACTMVRDVAKFLREWVVYHAAVGVDRFVLYDNGSQDDLDGHVRDLVAGGYDVTAHPWPWPKTQEAGFSHAAAAHRESCEWMAFVDVDEFIFSPAWAGAPAPSGSAMLGSVVASAGPDVGQITLGCRDFGPSGRTGHPREGVTQGYTCRRRAVERHKSVVRLGSVAASLVNSVHHFELRAGWRWERAGKAQVNHYKYQAWAEFKAKFRRRVSTYVADWTEKVNRASKDRTPGLGFEAVEPPGWAQSFCDVHDTLLRDATRAWFGPGFTAALSLSSSAAKPTPTNHHRSRTRYM